MDKKLLHEVFRREMNDRKIPLSLGKTCPVKCTFCYEKDTGYRTTFDTPLTSQEDWEFILKEIQSYPTGPDHWVVGGNEGSGTLNSWNSSDGSACTKVVVKDNETSRSGI